MKFDLQVEDAARRERLADIYEHVGEIARKIRTMEDDPLPHQLDRSIPNFLQTLEGHLYRLRRAHCSIVLAGDLTSDKNFVLRSLLGEEVFPRDQQGETLAVCELTYGEDRAAQVSFWDDVVETIKVADTEVFGNSVERYLVASEHEWADWPYQKAEVQIPAETLADGLTVVTIPSVGMREDVTRIAVEHVFNAAALIYVINWPAEGEANLDKLNQLVNLTLRNPSTEYPLFMPSAVIFVFCCPEPDMIDDDFRAAAVRRVKQCWPTVDETHVCYLATTDSPHPIDMALASSQQAKLHACISKLTRTYLKNRIQLTYSWLQSFVSRVLHHLRAFLSQSEKTQDERIATFNEIHLRLNQLTFEADAFFQRLRKEVDGKVQHANVMLRNHLLSDEVLAQMAEWSEEEAPTEQIWQEVDTSMREKISRKLYLELTRWEEENSFFKNLRPHLIQHFQRQFAGIEKQLTMVETMIARHDSRICLLDICESPDKDPEGDQALGFIPYNLSLNLGQKIALGVAAPLLVPIALAIAVFGLPIIGGIAAKDLIIEKIAENRLKEYNQDRIKYLQKRTPEEIRKFVKSKALEKYIRSQLQPAYRCIAQLEEVVPGQIDADRVQVESLRDDAREAKDYTRFYQPLAELFEYDKQMLMLYRVMYMTRDKIDILFTQVTQPQSQRMICSGLSSTVIGDFWIDGGLFRSKSKCAVSLRKLNHKLDSKTVEDYLQEEEAYRWQACSHIVKFYGVTKDQGYVYHVVEPLSCSLRHFCDNASELEPEVSDKNRFIFLKTKMIEVVKGLDYLHSRGWVHFDLSLDTVAVDAGAHVKLTNISSRRMVKVDRSLPKDEIFRYAHLPHEVLASPPAAYTPASEMYSVGIMMWEMWTGNRCYLEEIHDVDEPLSTIDAFVAFIEVHRPRLDMFYDPDGDWPTSSYAEHWLGRTQQCWAEAERLTSKAWLQLMDDTRAGDALSIKEHHFSEK